MLLEIRMLEDPLVLTLIIGAFVLVAVGIILYFLIFKKKIKEKIEGRKVKKAKKQAADNQSQSVASGVFQERKTSQPSEDELMEKSKIADEIVKRQSAMVIERNLGNQTKATEKQQKVGYQVNNEKGFDIMNQFGDSEKNKKKNKKEESN